MDAPDGGDHPLEREARGNRQAIVVARLARLIHEQGGLFTIENPVPSHLWECKPFVQLREFLGDSHHVATFDQCAYQLTLPVMSGTNIARKELVSLAMLLKLSLCHASALGSV
jgi:hypothetical protein